MTLKLQWQLFALILDIFELGQTNYTSPSSNLTQQTNSLACLIDNPWIGMSSSPDLFLPSLMSTPLHHPSSVLSSDFSLVLSWLLSLLRFSSSPQPALTPTVLHCVSISSPVLPSFIPVYINLSHEELLPHPRDEIEHMGLAFDVVRIETQCTFYRSSALCFSQRTWVSCERSKELIRGSSRDTVTHHSHNKLRNITDSAEIRE